MVSTYNIIAFITNEKAPKVMRLRGSVIMCKIGRRKIVKRDNIKPPKTRIAKPPDMENPLNSEGSTDKASAFIAIFLTSVFIKDGYIRC